MEKKKRLPPLRPAGTTGGTANMANFLPASLQIALISTHSKKRPVGDWCQLYILTVIPVFTENSFQHDEIRNLLSGNAPLFPGRFRRAIVLMQISNNFGKRLLEMAEIFQ